jgi:4-amino-4-deoxy-L-arabinose transferase-like glycosyltransferase
MRDDSKEPATWPLVTVLASFVLLGGLYSWLVPPFEGPDGPQHFAYVEWLAEGKGLPPQGERAWETPIQQEASQPPFYYFLASILARSVDRSNLPAVFRPNPHFPSKAPGTTPDNKNVAVHYPADTHPLRGGWLALYLARSISLCFGVLLIACVYGLAREMFPSRTQIALFSALVVATIPQVLFLSGVVSNDVAVAAISTLTLWLLAMLLRRGPSVWRALALGLAFGLAILCKTNALVLGLSIALGLSWLRFSRRQASGRVALTGFWIALGTFAVAGWWYVRTWVLYGTPVGVETHYSASWAFTENVGRAVPFAEWFEVFYSFWIAFGWGNIKPPGWVFSLLLGLTLASVAGLGVAGVRWWRRGHRPSATLVMLGILIVTLMSVTVALKLWMQRVAAPHGRLLFPAIAGVAILLVLGWRAIHPWLCVGGWAYLAILALVSPALLIHPAYAPPRTLTETEISALPPATGWRFGSVAELHSVTPLERSVTAGNTLPVRICWRTLARAERDYSVLLHIVGPGNWVVAGRYTYPGLGSYPTSAWKPDKVFCDVIGLDVPLDLSQTLLYKIEVGLLDVMTQERLPAYGMHGEVLGHTFASAVRLSPAGLSDLVGAPDGSSDIRLLDNDLTTTWHPGGQYDVTLHWYLAKAVDKDYTVFAHLRDPANGRNVVQADGPPVDGWYPTSWWTPGETVVDRHTFYLPSDVPPGKYNLLVGWYDLLSGERMGNEYLLAAIEVQP